MAVRATIFLFVFFFSASLSANELTELKEEIRELKQIIHEQGKRIKALERRLGSPPTTTTLSPSQSGLNLIERAQKTLAENEANYPASGWRNPYTWQRVASGMSSLQVKSILGPPTSSTESLGSVTLYYRGHIDGKGYVSGNVKLNADDRVWLINKPVF